MSSKSHSQTVNHRSRKRTLFCCSLLVFAGMGCFLANTKPAQAQESELTSESSGLGSGSRLGSGSGAPIDPASPADPAVTSPSLPPPFGSLNQDSFKATLMSIYGTTDPTPTAGAGSASSGMPAASSITGGAGPGGFNSPGGSLNGLGLDLNSLGGLSPQATGSSAALTNAAINAAAAQAKAAAALGAGSGGAPGTQGTQGTQGTPGLDNSATATVSGSASGSGSGSGLGSSADPSASGADSSPSGASSYMNTPGAEEAQRQAEELARQEGKLNGGEKQDGAGPAARSEPTSAGFFKVVPDSPARIALVEIRQGNYDSALVHLNQLWRLNPQAIELQYLMGVACVMSRRPREAEEHYRAVLQSASAPAELKQLALKGLSRLRPQ